MIVSKNISFNYSQKGALFSGLSIDLDNGIIGLLGKNGAGKSTLLKLFAGLLSPKTGELLVNGFVPAKKDPNYLETIYMVPEEFYLPPVAIKQFVNANKNLYPLFDSEKMDSILNEFELNRNEALNKLSHGQRKKFLIAFALATNSKVLFLDEPTNGLDIPSKSLFRRVLVSSISDEQTVLISTHQVKDIDTILSEIVVLDSGVVAFRNKTEEISSKYSFETIPSLHALENIIYHEKSPMGYRVIVPATDDESVIDLELLFNAIINKSL
jgi:ABC-2 type transport system ATP-binding protein